MLTQDPAIHTYLRSPIFFLMSWIVLLNTSACKCGDAEKPDQYEGLSMEVSPTSLVGDQITMEAIFKPADSQNAAGLTPYRLRLAFTEKGGSGSSFTYLDGTQTTHTITAPLEETIAHFTTANELNTQE